MNSAGRLNTALRTLNWCKFKVMLYNREGRPQFLRNVLGPRGATGGRVGCHICAVVTSVLPAASQLAEAVRKSRHSNCLFSDVLKGRSCSAHQTI